MRLTARLCCVLFITCATLLAQQKTDLKALFPINVNDKWGYIDVTGQTIIAPKFESAGEFSEGLAAVKTDSGWGYINATGELVIAARYTAAHKFSEGLARVQIRGDQYGRRGLWGFIDHTGNMVIQPAFQDLEGASEDSYQFHDGLAMIERDYKKGFIDKTGNIVIWPRYYIAYSFSEGLASVSEGPDRKWGYIDKTGNWVIQPQFEWSSEFSEGLGPVSLNGVCGYVDRTGKLKVTPKFKRSETDCAVVWGSFVGGLSRWMIGDKYGFINQQGETVIQPQFDLTFDFSDGLAFVEIKGRYGYIDPSGRMVIEPQFYHAKDFQNGLARVSDAPSTWGYINKKGEFVWKQPATTSDEQTDSFLQPGHTQEVHFVGWSPDGQLLVSHSGVDGWIKVWQAASGQLTWQIKAALLKTDVPTKSPDGKLLATGSRNKGYEIRDAQSGNLIASIPERSVSSEKVKVPIAL